MDTSGKPLMRVPRCGGAQRFSDMLNNYKEMHDAIQADDSCEDWSSFSRLSGDRPWPVEWQRHAKLQRAKIRRITSEPIGDARHYRTAVNRCSSRCERKIEIFGTVQACRIPRRWRQGLTEDRPIDHAAVRVLSCSTGIGGQSRKR